METALIALFSIGGRWTYIITAKQNIHHFFIKSALLQQPLESSNVKCLTCARYCIISDHSWGWCGTRFNWHGNLFTCLYGIFSSISVNPIEKKPLYHFHPGTRALTLGTYSCNFHCPWCQNHHISMVFPPLGSKNSLQKILKVSSTTEIKSLLFHRSTLKPQKPIAPIENAQFFFSSQLIDFCLSNDIPGLSLSFNEPTLALEYAVDLFSLARSHKIYTTFVSNGYMSIQALDRLIHAGLNALKIDIKGNEAVYRTHVGVSNFLHPWEIAKYAQSAGIHVEIVNLLIPTVNDSPHDIQWFVEKYQQYLRFDTPLHFNAYSPAYQFTLPATSVSILETARDYAQDHHIDYVYIGNVPSHPGNHTYCPRCHTPLILRHGYTIHVQNLDLSSSPPSCSQCGLSINLIPPTESEIT